MAMQSRKFPLNAWEPIFVTDAGIVIFYSDDAENASF